MISYLEAQHHVLPGHAEHVLHQVHHVEAARVSSQCRARAQRDVCRVRAPNMKSLFH